MKTGGLGQHAHEKMLNITIREMQIKTTRRCHLTPVSMAIIKKNLQRINSGEGVERTETSCSVGGNVNWCSHHGEQCGGSLKPKTRSAVLLSFSRSVVSDSHDPMDCSTPGLPILHHLPELAQTHIHLVSDAIQPSHLLSSPSPPSF